MKIKTINSILTKKFNEFLETIDDEEVRRLVKDNTVITGGCIASMLLKEKINDFDLYFTDILTTYKVAKYYLYKMRGEETEDCQVQICTKRDNHQWMDIRKDDNGIPLSVQPNIEKILCTYKPTSGEDIKYRVRVYIRSRGALGEQEPDIEPDQYDPLENEESNTIAEAMDDLEDAVNENGKYNPTFITDNAITLSNRIQLVLRFYGKANIIHENYDYVHVTNYWESKTGKVVTNNKALEAILAKELVYTGSRYPLASIFRIRKFIQRGWTINVGQILKAVMQLTDMDLDNPHIFAEQVMGVDVHYMAQLVKAIQAKKEEEPDLDVKSYAMNIIEKIFG